MKGKEEVKEIEDTLDTTKEYVEVPLHGNTPYAQITFFQGSLKVVVPSPPHFNPTRPIPSVIPSRRLTRWH
jgi:hypothetical protein